MLKLIKIWLVKLIKNGSVNKDETVNKPTTPSLERKRIKILATNQSLTRFLVLLASVKDGKNS